MLTPALYPSAPDAAPELPFVGREAELADLCGWVAAADVEVVELVGEPGVGKSRLARQLQRVVEPGTDVVLVDDAHLLGPGGRARQVEALRAPGRTVLVTDRRAGSGAAVTQIVSPLPVPDDYSLLDLDAAAAIPSLALLVAFRRTVQPSFVLDGTTLRAAAELCVHFRGVPRDLQVASTLLTTVDADLAASPHATRSPTVTALLSQSRAQHGLDTTADVAAALSPDARLVLAGAALGVDGLGRQALARITDLRVPRLSRATAELTDLGVLVAGERPSAGPGGLVHARFHVPVTALPVAAAVADPELADTLAHRCTAHHLDVVTRAAVALDRRHQVTGFAMLHAESANIRAALEHARRTDPALALDAVLGLRTSWRALGLSAVDAVLGYVLGLAVAWYETVVLLGAPQVGGLLLGALCALLYLLFLVAVTAVCAAAGAAVPVAAGTGIGVLLLLPVLGAVSALAPWLPSRLTSAPDDLLHGATIGDMARSLGVTAALTVVLVTVAVWLSGRRQPIENDRS